MRGYLKPISTLRRPLGSVDFATREPVKAAYERSDVCVVPAAGVAAEAMVALTLARCALEKFGGDSMLEVRRNLRRLLPTVAKLLNDLSHCEIWRSGPGEATAATITEFDDELRKLVDDMFESMYAAHGVGLAAPQIGISKRIAVIDVTFKEDPEAKIVLVNPEIIHTEGRIRLQRRLPESSRVPREGDPRAQSHRPRAESYKAKPSRSTGEDLLARALLHETDHLNGKLYIGHISALKRDMMKRKIRKLVKQGEW